MNKDVIYIEPEDDITDILANIKGAKNKIVALVPPKKSSVLRSAVNFKLIAKAATKGGKTVVLISSDESLLRLASSVKMPTAKNLQSKPQLPDTEDAVEFGEEKTDDVEEETIEDDAPKAEEAPAEEAPKKNAKAKSDKKDDAVAAAAAAEEVEELEDVEEEAKTKKDAKKKNTTVPNFKKYRKFIIGGALAIILLVALLVWANVVAPAAKISVKVRTTASNFSKNITLVTDASKADAENGIFHIEEKTVTKKSEAEFEAKGHKEVGTKASGKITVVRPAGQKVTSNDDLKFSIPKGVIVTIDGKEYVTTSAETITSTHTTCGLGTFSPYPCTSKDASATIGVEAKEVGDSYNISAVSSGVTLGISTNKKYNASSTAMTGGTSKTIKIVSEDDVKEAENLLENYDADARGELASEFSSDYILIGTSFKTKERKVSTSPLQGEEVTEGVTPKIVSETTYSIYAVQRSDIDIYIRSQVAQSLGDDTQEIYSSGIVGEDEEGADKAFFDAYKDEGGKITAKLKSTVKTGPRVTPEMVAEKSYGEKVGKVKSLLTSINGVSGVDIETSYFWVTSIPTDPNIVDVSVTIE